MNTSRAFSLYTPSLRAQDSGNNDTFPPKQSNGYVKSTLFFKKFISKLYDGFSNGSTNLKAYINLSKPLKKNDDCISKTMKSEFLKDKEQLSKFGKLTKDSHFIKLYNKLKQDSDYRPSELNLAQLKESMSRRKAIMLVNKYKSENKYKIPKITSISFKRGSIAVSKSKNSLNLSSSPPKKNLKQTKLYCTFRKKQTDLESTKVETEPKESEAWHKLNSNLASEVSKTRKNLEEVKVSDFNTIKSNALSGKAKRNTMYATEYNILGTIVNSVTASKNEKSQSKVTLVKSSTNKNLLLKSSQISNTNLSQKCMNLNDERPNGNLNSTCTLISMKDNLDNPKLAYLSKIAKYTSGKKFRNLDSILSNGSRTNELIESASKTLNEQDSLRESSRVGKASNKNVPSKKINDSTTTIIKTYLKKYSTKNISETMQFGEKLLENQNKAVKTQAKMNDLLFRSFYMTNDVTNPKNSEYASNLNEERYNNYKKATYSLLGQITEFENDSYNLMKADEETLRNLSNDRIHTLVSNLNNIGFEYDFIKYENQSRTLMGINQYFNYNNLHRTLQFNRLVKCRSNSVMSSNPNDYLSMKKGKLIETQISEFKVKQQSLELPSNIKTKFKSNTNRKYNEYSGCYIGKR